MARHQEKVFWTDDEKYQIVVRAVELRNRKLWDSPLHIFRAAMAALPPERRRKVRSISEVPWFVEMHDELLSQRFAHEGSVVVRVLRSGFAEQQRLLRAIIRELHKGQDILARGFKLDPVQHEEPEPYDLEHMALF